MNIELNGKKIAIPDEEIKKNMKILKITEAEAIQMYLEDEGYEVNEEVEALTKKAKDSGIMHTIHEAKAEHKTRQPRAKVIKEYPDKELLVNIIAGALGSSVQNLQITNKAKLIEFTYNGNQFKLDLVQKRPPKSN
jgi:hypothetical protein